MPFKFAAEGGLEQLTHSGDIFKCRFNEVVVPVVPETTPAETYANENPNAPFMGCTYQDPPDHEKNYDECRNFMAHSLRQVPPAGAAFQAVHNFVSGDEKLTAGYCLYNATFTNQVQQEQEKLKEQGAFVAGNKECGEDCAVKKVHSQEEVAQSYESATTQQAATSQEGSMQGVCRDCLKDNDCINAVIIPAKEIIDAFYGAPWIGGYKRLENSAYCINNTCKACVTASDCGWMDCPAASTGKTCASNSCVCQ
jgi:hypothetical protein